MSINNDLTLINDNNNFKLGHSVTFVCDVSNLTNTYEEFKLYNIVNNELTELVDVSDSVTNGLLIYKYYPQTTGIINIVLQTEEVSEIIHQSNTITLTVNNNSHAQNIYNANAALVSNLTSMGVIGASVNDGLATNIAKVLSVPPTQRGIELDTSITCTCPSSASVGVPFNITGVLTSSYDDTSQSNVDMHGGEIQGATIEIYNGNTLLGTCTTNIDGEYSYSYTPTVTGNLSIHAIYDSANDFYEDSASNSNSVSVHVPVSSVTLTATVCDSNNQAIGSPSDSAILSYVDGESALLTATVLDSNNDPVVGKTVSFDIVDHDAGTVISNIGTATTDSSGICSVYYYSKDADVLNIKCSCNNIESSSVQIEDCWKYDSLTTNNNRLSVTKGSASLTYSNDGVKIKGTATTDTLIKYLDLTLPNKYSVEIDINSFVTTDYTSECVVENVSVVRDVTYSKIGYYKYNITDSSAPIIEYNLENWDWINGDTLKYEFDSSTQSMKIYQNGVLKGTITNVTQNNTLRFKTHNGRWTVFKNLKIKSL
ncbi:MAG: Ig-like domain-containing protein [Methanobrevibacter sp.]|nr:Ig-like domain-containing protein [Methanosphaera sp.]MBR0369175.1 Ig-like domain-containing protein [Methanobrevibacter sp.]